MLRWVEMKRALALAATGLLWAGGCFTDASQESSGTGGSACTEGSLSCPCYPNNTCDGALVCFEGAQVCVPDNCSPLVAGCPCPAEGCGDGLVCEGPVCLPEGPSTSSAASSSDSGDSGRLDSGTTSTTTVDLSSTGERPPATAVTLYFSSSETPFLSGTGDTQSRVTVQELCDASMSAVDLSCIQSAAVFSTNDTDSVLDLPKTAGMPFSVPVLSTNGMVIAESFAALLDQGTDMTLLNLGVSLADSPGSAPDFFWCGSSPSGASGGNCEGWTRTDTSTGKVGQPGTGMGNFWLSNNDLECSEPAPVLCACWD